MRNKFEDNKINKLEEIEEKENETKEIKLKSEMYNRDNEKMDRREDDGPNDAIMWGCVIGFALFFILLICVIVFTN